MCFALKGGARSPLDRCRNVKQSPVESGGELGLLARKLVAGGPPPLADDLRLHGTSPEGLGHDSVAPPGKYATFDGQVYFMKILKFTD